MSSYGSSYGSGGSGSGGGGGSSFSAPDWSDADFTALLHDIDPEPDEGALVGNFGAGVTLTPSAAEPWYALARGGLSHARMRAERYDLTPLGLASGLDGFTVGIVLRAQELANDGTIFESASGAKTRLRFMTETDGSVDIGGRRLNADAFKSATSAAGVLSARTWHRLVGRWDFQGRRAEAWVDGVKVAEVTDLGDASGQSEAADTSSLRTLNGAFTNLLDADFRALVGFQSAADVSSIDSRLQNYT